MREAARLPEEEGDLQRFFQTRAGWGHGTSGGRKIPSTGQLS